MSDCPGDSRIKVALYMIEVLPEIFVHICHSDLRRLRFVYHEFYSLVEAYRTQFDKGLTALPKKIVLDVYRGGDVNTTAGYSRRSAMLPR
jgi:hypothetical protein